MTEPKVPRKRRSARRVTPPCSQEVVAAGTGVNGSGASRVDHAAAASSNHGGDVLKHVKQQRLLAKNYSCDLLQHSSQGPSANSMEPAPSSSRGAVTHVVCDDDEKLRLLKGKMLAVEENPPRTKGVKLMGDAIRSNRNAAVASANKRPGNTESGRCNDRSSVFWSGMGRGNGWTSSAGLETAVSPSLDTIGVVSDELRDALRELGATVPVRVYGKMLVRSDRQAGQTRLLMSVKRWNTADHQFPLDAFLEPDEREAARTKKGLTVLALDRAGNRYEEMICKYLECNSGYRMIRKWGDFLRGTNLVVPKDDDNPANDVVLDLWMFRYQEGELGIVFMHYRAGDAVHADAAFEEQGARPQKIRKRRLPEHSLAVMQDEDTSGEEDDGKDVVMEDADVVEVSAPLSTTARSGDTVNAYAVFEEPVARLQKTRKRRLPEHSLPAMQGEEMSGNESDDEDAKDMLEAAHALMKLYESSR